LASKRRMHFYGKMFQFEKPIYADYFVEALYDLGVSKLFCHRTTTQ